MCVFSYVAAGSDNKKSPHMQHKQIHQSSHLHQQSTTAKVQQTQHLPQQPSPKLQTIISKPNQSPPIQQKPIQTPLKQAGQPVPVKTEAVQPQQKLPTVPARRPSTSSTNISPPSSEPPKIKPPQLAEVGKRAQSVIVPTRGAPPPIPARSGSVSYSQPPTQQQIHPMRRQQTLNSAMPPIIPQAAPEFYIPQRRGSITRQQSSSSTTITFTSSPTTKSAK